MSKINITLLVVSALIAVCLGNDKFQLSRDTKVEEALLGYEAYAGQYPWYAVIKGFHAMTIPSIACGGTIISSRWILTAGRCIEMSTSYNVHIGTINKDIISNPAEGIISLIGIMHPLYSKPVFRDNDIGLIMLPTDIELGSLTVNAITLPWNLIATDLTMVYTHFIGFNWNELRWNFLQVLSHEECLTYAQSYQSYESVLCTLGTSFNEFQTPCGITDNPVLAHYSNGTWFQVGVGSEVNNCHAHVPTRFTRVTLFLDWISTVTGITA